MAFTGGLPWENGRCESPIGKLRDELLDREVFTTLREAEVLIEARRRHDDTVRPHSGLGDRPPASEATHGRSAPGRGPPEQALGHPAVLH